MSSIMIDEYMLTQPWTNSGAGTCVWSFAEKEGKEYFIKEFPAPTFPIAKDLSLQLRKKKEERCFKFYVKKKCLYDEIAKCGNMNLIGMQEFFLYRSKYYLITDKVIESNITIEQVAKQSETKKLRLLMRFAISLDALHQRHIIHGDIKPSNVLLQEDKEGEFIPKIIDFDAGFLEDQQPTKEEIVFDPSYVAPETEQYLGGDEIRLTTKVDVFAAGIIFHLYMTGISPNFEVAERWDSLGNKTEVLEPELSNMLSSEMKDLIWSMLLPDPEVRISMSQVVERLSSILYPPVLPPPPPPPPTPEDPAPEVSSKLIIRMGKKKDGTAKQPQNEVGICN